MLRKRSITLAGHATSLALEADFWRELDAAAEAEGAPLARLIARIDEERVSKTNGSHYNRHNPTSRHRQMDGSHYESCSSHFQVYFFCPGAG